MTKNLLFIFSFLLFSFGSFAQNNIRLNIHHKLNEEIFEMNRTGNNNINTPFKITRLEYYISEISLIHDGGQETKINDLWVLVNADQPTSVDLGVHNLNFIEKVAFHIGVDPAHNNSDPSLYPEGHPLALKLPSMHWGWAAGYNFIALEGLGGDAFNKVFQIHALGNENYQRYEIEQNVFAMSNQINLNIDGDYARAMEDLDASIGTFYHGTTKQARKLIVNFNDFVFSASENTSSINDTNHDISIFPNPVINNTLTLTWDANAGSAYDINLTDVTGKKISTWENVESGKQVDLNIQNPGLYFLSVIKDGYTINTKKVVVLQ